LGGQQRGAQVVAEQIVAIDVLADPDRLGVAACRRGMGVTLPGCL
jgi:hypothetical protein